jgi:hypothetical protein
LLVAVLIVAGLGLAIDRVIIGTDMTGPAESSAGVLSPDMSDPASLLIIPDPVTTVAGPAAPTLADRLRQATSTHTGEGAVTRDAFSVAPAWVPVQPGPGADGQGATQSAESFKQANHLDAVLVTGDQRCAVVNGLTLRLGESLQGYRLVAINERAAEFEADGVRVALGIRGGGPS